MNILVVSQWFPPEPGGGPARFLEMGREWARAGQRVTVLAGIPNWPSGVVHPSYRGRVGVREQVGGMEVHRIWVYPARNEGRTKRIANHLSFAASAPLAALSRREPADVVVATSPPLFAAAAGMLVARARRIPFVFDVRDLWPDAIFELGQMQSEPVRAGLRRLERTLYRRAAAVVPVAEAFVEPILQRGAGRVEVIPNGADVESFRPGPPDPALRSDLGWEGRFVVLYAGTLGMAHGLMTAVEAAEACRGEGILFSLIGDGADRPLLERAAAQRGLDNFQILPMQPRSRMPDLYRAADACLVALRPLPLFDGFIPSKIFEIMACARPMLASVSGRSLELVLQAGAGVQVEQGSGASLARASRRLRDDPGARAKLGRSGRRYVEQWFDRRTLAARYLDLLRDVAGWPPRALDGGIGPSSLI